MVTLLKNSPVTVPRKREGWQQRKERNILVNEVNQERLKYKAIKNTIGT